MSEIRHLRLFLSSPGDVAQERLIAQEVIEQLHYDPSFRGRIFIEVVAWDKPGSDTPMLATMTPQEAINQGLPKPSDCDIVIVIFWVRMGTPLPAEYVKPVVHQWADPGEMPAERYLSGTEWEFVDAFEGAIEDGLPLLVVYRRTEDVALKPKDPEFMKKLLQWQRVEAFFENFSNPDGSIRQGYNPYEQPEDFRKKFETHLRKLLNKLLEETPKLKTEVKAPPVPLWQGSPFPGLRSFENTDAPIFFGRGKETDDLIERLKQHRFVAVVGASGSGKSSLVWAGVIPRLEANAVNGEHTGSKDWRWLRFTPGGVGDNPFIALAVKLDPYIPGMETRTIVEKLATAPDALNELAAIALHDKPAWAELLLFIDQFEELVTLVNQAHRIAFAEMLCAAVKGKRVRVILTLRADFYHQIIPVSSELVELLQKGSYPLGAPDPIELYEMITKPAERAGLRFEGELAREILRDTGNEPGSLALLAYLLDELYQRRTKDGLLSAGAYKHLGRVNGAIGRRAETVFNTISIANKENILRYVFHQLIDVDEHGIATRRRTHFEQVNRIENALDLIRVFVKARLLVASEDRMLEVAHEALLRNWQWLAQWIEATADDHRLIRRVERDAIEWKRKGRPDFMRPSAEELKEFESACKRLHIKITNTTFKDYIEPEQARLLRELEDLDTPHIRRSWIGERLSLIGDIRTGVGVRADGLPDFEWCLVDISGRNSIPVNLKNIGRLMVKLPFYISKYPVTYEQFQAFIEHENGFYSTRIDWFEGLTKDENNKELVNQHVKFSNYPRDTVNWYQAIAFCRWVSYLMRNEEFNIAREIEYNPMNPFTWLVRLPTPGEWQIAATNNEVNNIYPWGQDWDERRANTLESGLGRTTAVGMYPTGQSLCKAQDMVGNVLEWTLSKDYNMRGSDDLGGSANRVLCGSSFNSNKSNSEALYTYSIGPSFRRNYYGFRLFRRAY